MEENLLWRIPCLERLWADDVGDTKGRCDHGTACKLARVATVVGAGGREYESVHSGCLIICHEVNWSNGIQQLQLTVLMR
jgi:hypothetical protein